MTSPATIYWHPHTNMATYDPAKFPVYARGKGAYIWDEKGNRYFDGTSALWFANIGHGNERVAEAIYKQALTLENFHTFVGNNHRPALDLIAKLAELSPIDDPRILLGSGGSDAADLALKLARRYWQAVGKPNKQHILSRNSGYHGLHGFGTSIIGDPELREGYGPLVPETERVADLDIDQVRATVERIGPENIAAIIAEPVIGAGGMIPATREYLQGLRDIADEHDILLIFDEVVTGFGRTGEWFASQTYGVTPDMTTFAKGVTSGYVPLGGVFVSRKVWAPFYDSTDPDAPAYWQGLTYSGHALAAAAALANLAVIEEDHLLDNVRSLSAFVGEELRRVFDDDPNVVDIRNKGLLGGVQLREGVDAHRVIEVLRDEFGQLARPCGQTVTISPPFISTKQELATLIAAIAAASRIVAREG